MLIITPDYVTQTVAPAAEPLSLAETKAHLRVDIPDEDVLISSLMQAAREYVENYTGRAFVERTYRAEVGAFYDAMRLPHKPIIAITEIKYLNTASPSVLTVLDAVNYTLSRDVVSRAQGGVWPAVYPSNSAVQITYTAGYVSTSSPQVLAENVPAAVKAAMLLVIGDLYENREGQIIYPGQIQTNKTVMALLDQYRVYA